MPPWQLTSFFLANILVTKCIHAQVLKPEPKQILTVPQFPDLADGKVVMIELSSFENKKLMSIYLFI